MVNVFVWLSKRQSNQKNVGHASMRVKNSYISWWPDEPAGLRGSFYPIRNKSFDSDIRDEGGHPDRSVDLNGLDEPAIVQWWAGFGLVREGQLLQGPMLRYNLTEQNCSTVVAMALTVGGGERFATWYAARSVLWRPQAVLDYATSIREGLSKHL